MAGKLGPVGTKLAGEAGANVLVLRAGLIADKVATLTHSPDAPQGLDALVGSAVELVRAVGDVGVSVSSEVGGLRIRLRELLQ